MKKNARNEFFFGSPIWPILIFVCFFCCQMLMVGKFIFVLNEKWKMEVEFGLNRRIYVSYVRFLCLMLILDLSFAEIASNKVN